MSLLKKFKDGEGLCDKELEDLYQELEQIVDDLPLLNDCTTEQHLLKSGAYSCMSDVRSVQIARKEK